MSIFFPPRPATQTLTRAALRPDRRLGEASVIDAGGALVEDTDILYRRLGSAPRDLLGTTLKRAMDLSVLLYRANPLANRIIKIYTSYLAGAGFTVSADNPEVEAVVREFWDSPRNRLDRHHKWFTRDKLLFGEGHHPYGFDEAGNTTVGFIDPATVTKIQRDPLNNMILTQIYVQRGESVAEEIPLQIVRVSSDPNSESAGLYEGEVSCFLHERVAAATRGTPFLLPMLDWLDAYDQILWELLERQKALRAHFYDLEVQGGADEVEKALEMWGRTAPRTGTVRAHTDAVKVTAVTPTLGAQEDVTAARYQLRAIATGAGLAPHWVGEPEDANRSTAESMDLPVLRSLADTQADAKADTEEMLGVAVDAKIRAGMLDRVLPRWKDGQETSERVPAKDLIRVIVPEIEDAKIEQAASSLAQVAQAFAALDLVGGVGYEVIQRVVHQILPALGVPPEDLPQPQAEGDQIVQFIEGLARRGDEEGFDNPALEGLRQRLTI